MTSIAAILPAFNEEKGIGRVLDILCQSKVLTEIIVVDDGSVDRTASIIEYFRMKDPRIFVCRHATNLGKGQSVMTGFLASTSKYILTIDADLFGLTPDHLVDLVEPVLYGEADMTLGIFRGGNWATDLSHRLAPWLTGQRCLRRDLIRDIDWKAATGYGLETAITIAGQKHSWRRRKVYWQGVSHPPSEGHRGLLKGIFNRSKMYCHILRAWYLASRDQLVAKIIPSSPKD
jgi:glycosyltransferase involved in cell wall biosynthesis